MVFRDVEIIMVFEEVGGSFCVYDFLFEIELLEEALFEMVHKFSEVDVFVIVVLAQPVGDP